MSHIEYFIGKVTKRYSNGSVHYHWLKIRAMAMHIIWKYNGLYQSEASEYFGIKYGWGYMRPHYEFGYTYNKILDLYIQSSKEWVLLNKK